VESTRRTATVRRKSFESRKYFSSAANFAANTGGVFVRRGLPAVSGIYQAGNRQPDLQLQLLRAMREYFVCREFFALILAAGRDFLLL
jgi:hypothetical protein